MKKLALALVLVGFLPLIAPGARAEQAAAQAVRAYQAALIDTMRRAQQLGYEGRYQALAAPVTRAFDLAYMAQRAAGPAWGTMNEAQRRRYVETFTRYSIAQHASRFKTFGGESFEILGTDDVGRGFWRVRTVLATGTQRIALDYLIGQREGGWRIVDVFSKGTISEVSTRRADFATTLRDRGVDGLIQELESKITAAKTAS